MDDEDNNEYNEEEGNEPEGNGELVMHRLNKESIASHHKSIQSSLCN